MADYSNFNHGDMPLNALTTEEELEYGIPTADTQNPDDSIDWVQDNEFEMPEPAFPSSLAESLHPTADKSAPITTPTAHNDHAIRSSLWEDEAENREAEKAYFTASDRGARAAWNLPPSPFTGAYGDAAAPYVDIMQSKKRGREPEDEGDFDSEDDFQERRKQPRRSDSFVAQIVPAPNPSRQKQQGLSTANLAVPQMSQPRSGPSAYGIPNAGLNPSAGSSFGHAPLQAPSQSPAIGLPPPYPGFNMPPPVQQAPHHYTVVIAIPPPQIAPLAAPMPHPPAAIRVRRSIVEETAYLPGHAPLQPHPNHVGQPWDFHTLPPPPPDQNLLQATNMRPMHQNDRISSDARFDRVLNITLGEMMMLLPNSMQNPEACLRIFRNGAVDGTIAEMQMSSYPRFTWEGRKKLIAKLKHQRGYAVKTLHNVASGTWLPAYQIADPNMTSAAWRSREFHRGGNSDFGYVKLKELYRYIPRNKLPQGEDRWVLTMCCEFQMDHPDLDLDTSPSHLQWILQFLTIPAQTPPHPGFPTHDHATIARHKAVQHVYV